MAADDQTLAAMVLTEVSLLGYAIRRAPILVWPNMGNMGDNQVEGRSWIYVQHVNLAFWGVDP